jgi:protease IV
MNTNLENNQYPVKKTNGCLFAIMAFLSSCFIGIIILVLIGFFLLSGTLKKITDKPLTSSNSFKEIYHSGNSKAKNKIALIKINGIILDGEGPWSTAVNAENICDKLSLAASNKNIKAVILDINSPGGEITATDKIYHYIQKVRKANKPVVSLLESVAASGGYYAAVGTDYIIANRLTTTGSIGVLVNSFNFYKLLNKIGIDDEVYKSKEMKDLLNPARPRTPAEKKIVQNLVNESYSEFVKIVSKGRISKNPKLTTEYIENSEIGDGRIFSGAQALKLGLIDKLGYFENAEKQVAKMANLKKDNYQIVTYKENLSLTDLFQKFMSENFSLKINIPGINQYSAIELGKFYYLYTGF